MAARRRPVVATALATVLLVGSASASPRGAGDALREARAHSERLQMRAAAIRSDLTSGSFARVVGRLADMAGLPAPSPLGTRTPRTDLPPALAGPIADLLAAATAAGEGTRAALESDGGAHERLSRRADRLGARIAGALALGKRWPVERARALKAEVVASPVLRAAARGGVTVAGALDRSLDPLREAAAAVPPAPPAAACDVLDQRPALCVNGTGANAIDAEAVLVIDLGGDDAYTSSAGSASSARCVDDPEDPSCNASVLIDLGGDDTYDVSGAVSHDHLVGAGSALTGVGVLVDVAGDDRYLAPIDRGTQLDLSFAFGSADMGLGLLADLTGDDTYELTGEPDDLLSPYLLGSSLTGMGAVLDLDGVNDYRVAIEGAQTPSTVFAGLADETYQVMAAGVFGAGALVDRTGYARFEARVEATAGPQDENNYVAVIGQGAGLIGDAALLTGPGPTTFEAVAHRVASATLPGQSEDPVPDESGEVAPIARIPGGAQVTGQGVGALGFAVLDDTGGDDVYRTHARSEHRLVVRADEGCGCDRAIATLDVTGLHESFGGPSAPATAGVSVHGVGSSIFAPDAGVLLHDHAGDDTYAARAELDISVRAENTLGDPSGGARAEAIPSIWPSATAFGQGLGSDFAPTIVQDDGGDDSYELVSEARTDASAEGGTASATSIGSEVATHGQGSSYWDPAHGAVFDLGGRDRYEAHASSRAMAAPGMAYDALRTISAQGAVGGMLVDLDDGLADAFTATPEPGPGVGRRGEGPGWIDTVNLFPGYGIAPLQPAKRDVVVTMDPANPASASEGIASFRARLTDGGAPLAGRELTFDIEFLRSSALGESWEPHRFSAHGITDADGWATGRFDIDELIASWGGSGEFRIAARFHGDAARRSALGAAPFAT